MTEKDRLEYNRDPDRRRENNNIEYKKSKQEKHDNEHGNDHSERKV